MEYKSQSSGSVTGQISREVGVLESKNTDKLICIVEDQNDSAISAIDTLKAEGYRYDRTLAGWQLFHRIKSGRLPRHIDLILLALHIPGQNGFTVLDSIRQSTLPQLANTKVVAVGSRSEPKSVEQARAAGFNGFIGKPINPQRFKEQVRSILSDQPIWEL